MNAMPYIISGLLWGALTALAALVGSDHWRWLSLGTIILTPLITVFYCIEKYQHSRRDWRCITDRKGENDV